MDTTTDAGCWTPLHEAARAGDLDTVRRLLTDGAVLETRAPGGATALHHAAYFGHAQVTRELLTGGADPEALDGAGYTALMWARERCHRAGYEPETVEALELVSSLDG